MVRLKCHQLLVPVLALAIPPHAVHGVQTVKLLMETVDVVIAAITFTIMTAVQMLPAQEVSIEILLFCMHCNKLELLLA